MAEWLIHRIKRVWISVLPIYVLSVLLCTFFLNAVDARVRINEFIANNVSVYPDMWDFDDFTDWIELYNPDNENVNLSGYYLTDNLNRPTRWAIPKGTTIPAHGFLVIRADGYDSDSGVSRPREFYPWNDKFTTIAYHTNFKLSSEGEEIGLFRDSSGVIIKVDQVKFSNQLNDIAMGRNPDNPEEWLQYDQPTPNAPNTTRGLIAEKFSGSVSFSITGGFFEKSQSLTLSCAGGTIHYTLDGSMPNEDSPVYSDPLTLSATTVVRARCIEDGKFAGKISTQTYFISDKARKMMVVAISTDKDLLYDKQKGIFENSLKGREVPIAFEVFTSEGKQITNVNAGMWIGSLSNFSLPQKPLQIALKGGKYGDDFIWYQLFSKPAACYPRLRLRQGGDAWETNMITDAMLEAICTGQMEVGTQAFTPVVVFINGEYYGLHDMREQFDDQYFFNNYGVDPSTKDEVRTMLAPPPAGSSTRGGMYEAWILEDGSWDTYATLMNIAKDGSLSDEEQYGKLDKQMNINSCIDFFIGICYGNAVSWTHNQDLWRIANGKWNWLLTDFDRCFNSSGLGGLGGGMNGPNILTGTSGVTRKDTLLSKIIDNKLFREHFAQRCAAHLNSTFSPKRMNKIVDSIKTMISPEMPDEIEKWGRKGGISSLESWNSEIRDIKDFIDARVGQMFNQFGNDPFSLSGKAKLTITSSEMDAGDFYIEGVPMTVGLEDLTFFTDIPLTIKAVPRPGYLFAGWKNNGNTDEEVTITLSGDISLTAPFVKAEDIEITTHITENTTLDNAVNAYFASEDIIVDKGVTFTLEKGVTLLMPQDGDILVKGTMHINGTQDAPVTIKANDAAGAANWGALNFEDAADTNKLTWTVITGTTLGNDPLNQRAGINGNNSNVVMDHLTMHNIIYPLYFEGGSTVIRNSSITIDHICNGAIHIGRGGAVVENSVWLSTGVTMNTDAIDIKGVENGIVQGNLVYNFNGFNSDAIDLGEGAKNILIHNNIVYGSCDKGISIGGKSTAIVTNNLIVECDLGIGIKDSGSHAEIDHNTFVRNRIGIACYEKAFGRGSGSANVSNTIVATSKSKSYYAAHASVLSFSHCFSDLEIMPGSGNRMGDPLFIDPVNNNFQLKENSPCIDLGDPAATTDPDGSVTDIGAQYTWADYHFPREFVPPYSPPVVVINELMYNDDKNSKSDDWIELYNTTDAEINLEGWKLTDKSDYDDWEISFGIADVDSDAVFFFPEGTIIPAGGYLVVARTPTALKNVYPGISGYIGSLPFGLDGKETVLLYNNNDVLVNAVSYTSKTPWPVRADGKGASLELVRSSNPNQNPFNWNASDGIGSPGRENTVTSVKRPFMQMVPLTKHLSQNFPNPCHGLTTIQFALPKKEHVRIAIYNLSGRLIEILSDEKFEAGIHSINFTTGKYSAGVYFYRIHAGTFIKTRKMTVQ